MAIDAVAGLKYLGFDPETIESEEAFKEAVTKTYVKRENAHADDEIAGRIFGKVNGTLRSKLKAHAKELGIEGEFDKIDPVEGIEVLGRSVKERIGTYNTQIEELKRGVKPTKEIEELSHKYTEAKSLAEQYKEQLGAWEQKYTSLESSVKERETQARIDAQWERAFDSLKFNEGVNKYAIDGFKQAAKQRYGTAFDDEGKPYAIDLETKKRVPNPNKAHEHLGLEELVRSFAEKEKLVGGSPQGGAPVRRTINLLDGSSKTEQGAPAQRLTEEGLPVRRVMPRSF